MNVLYLVSRLVPRGPIRVLYNTIAHLDRTLFQPTVCTLSPEAEKTMQPQFEALGVPVHTLAMSRWNALVRGGKPLKQAVSDYSADVVHTHGIRPDVLAAKYLPHEPVLATIHNFPYQDYLMKFGPLLGRAMAWQHLRALRRLEYPVACSASIAEWMKNHGVDAAVVRNGISTDTFRPVSDENRRQLRLELGLSPEGPVIVWIGALIALKDPITLLNALRADPALQNVTVCILGKGNLQDTCQEVSRGLPNVHLEGHVDNVNDYLRAADLFVSTSTSEGLPNAVLEALASGVPVCLSDIAPHREILSFDDKAGLLFAVGDVDALARALNQMLDVDLNQARLRARAIATNHLSAQAMSRGYQEMYRALARTVVA